MIASVANFDPVRIPIVAAQSYALTLWAHLHKQDQQYLEALVREDEEIRFADTIAVAFHNPKELKHVIAAFRAKLAPAQLPKSIEQLAADADDLWNQHHRSDKKRPVS